MTIDLSGQTVLVTGASRGIGKAVSLALADSGARVAAHYNRNEPDAAPRIVPFRADLASLSETDRLFDAVIAEFGRVDALVLNAGVAVAAPMEAPTEQWSAAWDMTMHVNLRSSEHLTRRMRNHVRDREGKGRIIYVASRAAFRGDTPDYLAYASSKAGMVALARSVARGCGPEGLRAFVVAPGFTRTDMAQDFIDRYGEDYALRSVATERLTEPSDIAPIVTLLASGLADHATGCTIDVNAASYVH
jgi:3-oxoacyl-[acyl-carrier protein] reductase